MSWCGLLTPSPAPSCEACWACWGSRCAGACMRGVSVFCAVHLCVVCVEKEAGAGPLLRDSGLSPSPHPPFPPPPPPPRQTPTYRDLIDSGSLSGSFSDQMSAKLFPLATSR